MAPTHTTGSGGILLRQPITGEEAATHHAALDQVLGHLKAAGINAQLIQRRADRCAITIAVTREPLWHPPELIIYANAGWRIATVTIGACSGSYMVELARVGTDDELRRDRIEVVPPTMPSRVARLVAQNAGAAA
ncbi:hypothetical protein [Nonomuraea basaltis]|uniref:hypothetical protein n=1 Tax=Nonomuraea basaltis TaxID=2495887 RepID=UPI00110C5764|nr:hypothetical protein [Nonomuraea basaltis]TMR98884.1 hypothetical protein EJK15_10090 [Nonomuraea basaltis]